MQFLSKNKQYFNQFLKWIYGGTSKLQIYYISNGLAFELPSIIFFYEKIHGIWRLTQK